MRFVAEGESCITVLTGKSGFKLDPAELISRTQHLDSPKHLMVTDLMQRLSSVERSYLKVRKGMEKNVKQVD